MSPRFVVSVLLVIAALGCSAGSERGSTAGPPDGGDGQAGASAGTHGSSGAGGPLAMDGGGAAGTGQYSVAIHAGNTVLCPGECAELTADAMNGNAPYEYAWEPPLGDGPGPHVVCPEATTTYRVTARDTATDDVEFGRPSRSTEAGLEIVVEPNDAQACSDVDAGASPYPETTTEQCTRSIPFEDSDNGGPLHYLKLGSSLATDDAGNVFVAGSFRGRIDLGAGFVESESQADIFVAKYDASCELLWSRTFGESGVELHSHAMDVGPNGKVVIGGMLSGAITGFTFDGFAPSADRPSPFVAILEGDSASVHWAWTFSSPYGDGAVGHLAVDGANDIVLSGHASSGLVISGTQVGQGEGSIRFIAKLSSIADAVFAYELINTDLRTPLAVARDGAIALSSWAETAQPVEIGSQSFALAGDHVRRFIARLEPDAVPAWSRALDLDLPWGDSGPAGDVAFDGDGNLFVEHGNRGDTADPSDEAAMERISKLSAQGELIWSREVTPSEWRPTPIVEGGIATDAHGNVIHSYEIENTEDAPLPGYTLPPDDVVVQKLDRDGMRLWRHRFSTDVYESTFDVCVGADDAVWVGHGTDPSFPPFAGTLRITKLTR